MEHLIDMEKVIKGLGNVANAIVDGYICEPDQAVNTIADALALLKEQDAVVLCKDCNECYFASNRAPHEQSWACGKHGIDVTPNWFCADGKRRTDDV